MLQGAGPLETWAVTCQHWHMSMSSGTVTCQHCNMPVLAHVSASGHRRRSDAGVEDARPQPSNKDREGRTEDGDEVGDS